MRQLGFVVLAFVFGSAIAADEPLAFKGLQLGAGKAEVLKQYPKATCTANLCMMSYDIAAREIVNAQYKAGGNATSAVRSPEMEDLRKLMSVAGTSVDTILFTLYDDKVGRISMQPAASRYETLETAFLDRYGKPTSDERETVTTKAGVAMENRILRWQFSDGEIWVRRYSSTVDKSSVVYLSNEGGKRLLQDAERQRQKAAKDL